MAPVRRMSADDVQGVLFLWNQNCEEVERGLSSDEAENVSSNLRRYVDHDEAGCFVAEEAGEIIGFATFCVQGHPVMEGLLGEIEELYVRPEARRRRIGSQLVRNATNEMRRRGASVLRALACVDNAGSVQFLGKQGWENDMAVFSLYDDG